MLCYQSSRKPADILHDTFYWLSMYSGMLRIMAWPIIIVSVIAVYVLIGNASYGSVIHESLIKFMAYPVYSVNIMRDLWAYPITPAMLYAILAFFTSLMSVPLIMRYFVDHRSLLRLNYTSLLSELRVHLWSTLITALAMGVGCYLLCEFSGLLMVVIAFLLIGIIPYIMMWSKHPAPVRGNWWHRLLSSTYILVICFIICALPYLIDGLIILILNLIDYVIPGIMFTLDSMESAFEIISALLMCIAFCYAVVVFQVSALLLHGSTFTPKPQD